MELKFTKTQVAWFDVWQITDESGNLIAKLRRNGSTCVIRSNWTLSFEGDAADIDFVTGRIGDFNEAAARARKEIEARQPKLITIRVDFNTWGDPIADCLEEMVDGTGCTIELITEDGGRYQHPQAAVTGTREELLEFIWLNGYEADAYNL